MNTIGQAKTSPGAALRRCPRPSGYERALRGKGWSGDARPPRSHRVSLHIGEVAASGADVPNVAGFLRCRLPVRSGTSCRRHEIIFCCQVAPRAKNIRGAESMQWNYSLTSAPRSEPIEEDSSPRRSAEQMCSRDQNASSWKRECKIRARVPRHGTDTACRRKDGRGSRRPFVLPN